MDEIIPMHSEGTVDTPLFNLGARPNNADYLLDWALYRRGELNWDQEEEKVDEHVKIRWTREVGAAGSSDNVQSNFWCLST